MRSKAATFEHLWMGNLKVSAIECMTLTEPAGTPTVSAILHESKHQPPLARLQFALDDVWCASRAFCGCIRSKVLHLLKERKACHSVLLHPVLHSFVRSAVEQCCRGTPWDLQRCQKVMSICANFSASFHVPVYNHCACNVLAWALHLCSDTFFSWCLTEKLVSKVGLFTKVRNIRRPSGLLSNSILPKTPKQQTQSLGA